MNKIKKRRRDLELTQYQVEKLTGIQQSRLSLIESGYREPNAREREMLARALRTDESTLFQNENQESLKAS